LWQTDAARGTDLARKGQYQDAAEALEPAVAGGNFEPAVVEALYYSWVRTGEYAKALQKFEAWSTSNPTAGPVRLAAGRINHLTGNYARALQHLDAIQNSAVIGVAATYEKSAVLKETGKRDEAEAIYKKLIADFQNGTIRNPSDAVYAARAMWATQYFHDANDVFKVVAQGAPQNAEAFVAWGDLLAEKYNEQEAVDSYKDALNIDPNMPEAHLGLAKILALTDPEESFTQLEGVLKTNPKYPEAHRLVANQQIDSEQYETAEAEIAKALEVNPQSPESFSLLASINFLRGNKEEFNKYVQKVLQINPYYSDLYYILADNCVSLRLYSEAVEFAKEAVRLDPKNWAAQSLLGLNQLRLAEEEAGKATLEKAYEGDPFNVWNVNTLKLLDSFENFDRIESPHFRIKLQKKESAVLRNYVVDLLEKAYKDLSAKYQFTPNGPITFEMFPDHDDFAVRTLGLPGISALGATFGKLVSMDSPTARPPDTFNWGSTLWHEFMHVISLQVTDHKIPRWFSEGLSVFEERKGFPGWGDDLKLEYLQAIKMKKLLPVSKINDGFIRPKFPNQVLVSYYQASVICEYVDQKYGFPAILKMLALYKEGKDTEEVFKQAMNVSLTDFDTAFLAWIDDRTKGIDETNFIELAGQGQESLAKGDIDKAIEVLSRAVQMYPEYTDEHNPYEPLAEAYLKKGDKRAAIDTLKKFMTYSETSYASAMKLGELLLEAGDIPGASQAFESAVYIRPMDIQLHQKFGAVLLTQKQYASAAKEYEALVALNAPDRANAYYGLAEANLGMGKRDEARKNVLKSLEVAPSYEPAQELLLKLVR
jgi:tetratricopeptide (TPR) repeat protein